MGSADGGGIEALWQRFMRLVLNMAAKPPANNAWAVEFTVEYGQTE